MTRLLLPLLCLVGSAGEPDVQVARAMARVDALVAQEAGKDARDVAKLDRRARGEFKEIESLGWRAAAALGQAAKAPSRSAKAKLFAVLFLGKLHDPAVARPLAEFLLDPAQDPDARAAAASGLSQLDIPPAAARRDLCAAISQPELPMVVRDEVLIGLTRLGCPDGETLDIIARSRGSRPQGRDLIPVRRALIALSRSRGEETARHLLRLIGWFPPGTPARTEAFNALSARRNDLRGELLAASLDVAREGMRSEAAHPTSLLSLIPIAEALGAEGDALLIPLANHPDAEVIAAAAEALARRKAVRALPALEAILAGALQDPRFSPRDGRPDPAILLARLERAVKSLRLSRAAAR